MDTTQQNKDKVQYTKLSDFIRRINNRNGADDGQKAVTI
jgi:hypothetical protein